MARAGDGWLASAYNTTPEPLLNRDPDELRGQLCIGPAEHCAELLSRYAEAGCERVYLWPLGDEQRQLELVVSELVPMFMPTDAGRYEPST